ncbi:unnamed protein product [Prorocentrum cordatum]|uniref:Uncharacterized protein n=1 Tax=Prorocentrum cordatum TaxID=2364126 RepID=A0ABN9WUI2_9DINO|nr:unnamed protein product [Polarella glacialis]
MGIQVQDKGFCEPLPPLLKQVRKKNPDMPLLGPLYTLMFGVLLVGLAEIHEVGSANVAHLKKTVGDFNCCEKVEEAAQLIRACRITKTAKDDQAKLILGEKRYPVTVTRQLEARHLRGVPGYMEELQEWTEWLVNQ